MCGVWGMAARSRDQVRARAGRMVWQWPRSDAVGTGYGLGCELSRSARGVIGQLRRRREARMSVWLGASSSPRKAPAHGSLSWPTQPCDV